MRAGGRDTGPRPGDPATAEERRIDHRGLLVVTLGEVRFGIWADEVLEVVKAPPISRLPVSSREVAGMTHVRGDIIPVLDLGLRLLDAPARRPGHMVLVHHRETGTVVGLLVDRAASLIAVAPSELLPPPRPSDSGLPEGLATGVVMGTEAAVTVLHLGRAAAPPGPTTEEG